MKLTKETLKQIIKEELNAVMQEQPLEEASGKMILFQPGQNEFQIMLGNGKSITFLYSLAGNLAQDLRQHLANIAGTNVKHGGRLHPNAAKLISQRLASQTDAKISPEELMQMSVQKV